MDQGKKIRFAAQAGGSKPSYADLSSLSQGNVNIKRQFNTVGNNSPARIQ